MTVLVDDAVWSWRGDRWAHLISDDSLDELHDFAARLGRRRFSFQGDHYDVPSGDRDRAVAFGAEPTDGRTVARRLRAAGLRLRPADRPPRWQVVHDGPAGDAGQIDWDTHAPLRAGVGRIVQAADRLGDGWQRMVVGVRIAEIGLLLTGPQATVAATPDAAALGVDVVHRSAPPHDAAAIELFVREPATGTPAPMRGVGRTLLSADGWTQGRLGERERHA